MNVPVAEVAHEALATKVQVHISCRGLPKMDTFSKSDPFVVISTRETRTSPWKELMRTETVWDNHHPDFVKPLELLYQFEKVQEIKADVYDQDSSGTSDTLDLQKQDYIGTATLTLSKIMSAHGQTYSADVSDHSGKSRGKIVFRGEEVSSNNDVLHVKFACAKLTRKNWFGLGHSDPFIAISRSREDGGWVKVWESETIKSNLNPVFNKTAIKVQTLCNGDIDRPIRFQVFDWESDGSHQIIGEFTTSIRSLTPDKSFDLKVPGKKNKLGGTFKVLECQLEKRASFLDYIKGGCEINLIVAIDMTASNGAPSTASSLHYQHAGTTLAGSSRNFAQMNEYQKAILSIGEILQDYDSDNLFPVYGFGGQINGRVNHCFPLTFDPDNPSVQGVQGIMEAYANSFQYVSLSGPTLFAPILGLANQKAREQDSKMNYKQEYTILLIITDGIMNDLDSAVEQIVRGSDLPLSIIIVGVGNADFEDMNFLDADDVPLQSGGRTMKRDIVQFVPFRKFMNQHYSTLAAETLAEVPEQLLSYFASKKIPPRAPTAASSRHLLGVAASQRQLTGVNEGVGPAPPVFSSSPSPSSAATTAIPAPAPGTAASGSGASIPFGVPVASAAPNAPSAPPPSSSNFF